MASAPQLSFPPIGVGIPNYPTPHVGYILLTQRVTTEDASYTPLDPQQDIVYTGIDAGNFPATLYLVKQVVQPNGIDVLRYWSNLRETNWQDTWNYAIKFDLENNSYPLYIREYILPRKTYAPLTKGTSLSSILCLSLVSGGTGYTSTPVITLHNTDATAVCIVTNGAVASVYITNPGSSITGTVTASFAGGGGSGASANVITQPSTSVLLKEEMAPLEPENPLSSLFVRVTRIYGQVTGPTLSGASIQNPRIIPEIFITQEETDTTQQKVPAGTVPSTPIGEGSENSVEPIDSVVSKEVNKSLNITSVATRTGFELIQGKVVPIVQSIVNEGVYPTVDSTTLVASGTPLPGGKVLQKIGSGTLFDVAGGSASEAFKLPPEFTAAGAVYVSSSGVVAGTSPLTFAVSSDGTGLISGESKRVDENKIENSVTNYEATIVSSYTEYSMQEGQLVTIVKSLSSSPTIPSITSLTVSAESTNIGYGKFRNTVASVAQIFDRKEESKEQTFRIPTTYYGADTEIVSSQSVLPGTSTTVEAIGTSGSGILSESNKRIDDTKILNSKQTITGTLNTSYTEFSKNGAGQAITISITRGPSLSIADGDIGATTEIAEVRNLGGGQFEKRIGNADSLFDAQEVKNEQGMKVPSEFLPANAVYVTQSVIVAGDTPTPDSLGVNGFGILTSSAQRVTKDKLRKESTTLTSSTEATSGFDVDIETGLLLPFTKSFVPAGTDGLAVDSSGTYQTVEPFNANFSILTTRKAIDSSYSRTWNDIIDYSFPRVLSVFNFYPVVDNLGFIVKVIVDIQYLGGYSGPVPVEVTESWSSSPPSPSTITAFLPRGAVVDGVFASFDLVPCLHNELTYTESAGTDHPDFPSYDHTWTIDATTPTALPDSAILSVRTVPWRGGYKQTIKTCTAIPS